MVLSPTTVLDLRYGLTQEETPEFRPSRGMDLRTLGFSQQSAFAARSRHPDVSAGLPQYQGAHQSLHRQLHRDLLRLRQLQFGRRHFDRHRSRLGRHADARSTANIPCASAPTSACIARSDSPADSTSRRSSRSCPLTPTGRSITQRSRRSARSTRRFCSGFPAGQMTRSASFASQNTYYAGFVQDDWKLAPKLTRQPGTALRVRIAHVGALRSRGARLRPHHSESDRRAGDRELREESDPADSR